MIVVYTPEGGEPEQYDARRLLTSEATIAASAVGMRWAELRDALTEDDPAAMRAIAWVSRKRVTPTLRFKDFDPGVDELALRYDQREIAEYIDEALKVDGHDDERQVFFATLVRRAADPARAEAQIKELSEAPAVPKEAESPTSTSSD